MVLTICLMLCSTAIGSGRITTQNSIRLLLPPEGTTSVGSVMKNHGWKALVESGELQADSLNLRRKGIRTAYRQYYDGLPVIGGRLVITADKNGKVTMVHSSLATWVEKASANYLLSADEALALARLSIAPQNFVTSLQVEKVVLPVNGTPVFCYRVQGTVAAPTRALDLYIDGSTGAILLMEDRLKRYDGRGLVFDPDPKSALQNDDLEDNDDDSAAVPAEAYSEVSLPDISWDEDSLLVLSGPNVDTRPTENRIRSETGNFFFDRSDDQFEEVMAYYHIDRQARYVREFNGVPGGQLIDVNRIEEDASFFNPQTRIITTGRGGVDDAEDADVLIHEYTHALIEGYIPDWRGGETGLMSEGICDYFAGDYSREIAPDFEPMQVYNWDGHNEFWDGRILNSEYHYPEDCRGDIHDAGQLWSSLLTEVRLTGDRDDWNNIVLQHFRALADSVTVTDAACALMEFDALETGGTFRRAISNAAEWRGIFTPGQFAPLIQHQPLRDSEDENASFQIRAEIEAQLWGASIDTNRVWLVYQFDDSEPESLRMTKFNGVENEFSADIPPPNRATDISYYLVAADMGGLFGVAPEAAPEEQYHFRVGPDMIRPSIVEMDSLRDSVFPTGNANYTAVVGDNLGIAGVRFLLYDSDLQILDEFILDHQDGSDEFHGRIDWQVRPDEILYYRIRVTDAANQPNLTYSPYRAFTIRSETMFDDFEYPVRQWRLTGWDRKDRGAYSGEWSLRDRNAENVDTPREAIAEIDQSWSFRGMNHARLLFAEKHAFSNNMMEHGVIEIREEGEGDWREIFTIAGAQMIWIEREINLDRWAMRNSPAIRLRFRTITPENARQATGWRIDDLRLRVGNIVAEPDESSIFPVEVIFGAPFPNPTNGFISFEVASEMSGHVTILDIAGRQVLRLPIPKGRAFAGANLEGLPAGRYWLHFDGTVSDPLPIILLK